MTARHDERIAGFQSFPDGFAVSIHHDLPLDTVRNSLMYSTTTLYRDLFGIHGTKTPMTLQFAIYIKRLY
jgi:hypothetical protein